MLALGGRIYKRPLSSEQTVRGEAMDLVVGKAVMGVELESGKGTKAPLQ